jgi:hypothetical protein
MPQSLSTLIRDRNRSTGATTTPENNLETGQIFMFVPGTMYSQYSNQFGGGFCWQSPGTGTAVIEVWGAGGSTPKIACCGFGIPGNSGAYARKTISVVSGSYICGIPGFACGVNGQCFRGCSDSTGVCWCVASGNSGCICSQGGRGGIGYCSTGTGGFCCFYFSGAFCGTGFDLTGSGTNQCLNQLCTGNICGFCGQGPFSTSNVGIICNQCSGAWQAQAYGGDVNCQGIIGCTTFCSTNGQDYQNNKYHVPTPAGLFTTDGGVVSFAGNGSDDQSAGVTKTLFSMLSAMGSMSKAPRRGMPHIHCWQSGRQCGCYEFAGCIPTLPIGTGAPPGQVCGDLCDHGYRGGMGAVRIKFF